MKASGTGTLVLTDDRTVPGNFNISERGRGVHNLIFLPLNFDASLMKAEAADFIDDEDRFSVTEIKISRRIYKGEITLWCACKVETVTKKQVQLHHG